MDIALNLLYILGFSASHVLLKITFKKF